MSDEQTLLAVIAAIYLVDCLFWIPRSGLAFTRWMGKFWTLRSPSTLGGNDRGAFGLTHPLPPLGVGARAVGWTISISEHGVFSYISAGFNDGGRPPQTALFVEWAQIKKIGREGKKIFINDQHFANAVSDYSARRISQDIANLQKLNDKKRAVEIESKIAASCDPARAHKVAADFLERTQALRIQSNFLLLFLFAVCPYAVWRYGIVTAIWPVVIGIYVQTIVIGLMFSKLHRQIYPADSDQILKPFLTMLLAAPSAIRAQDILGRPLLESYHPLAAARALCDEKKIQEFAGVIVRDLRFPRLPVVPPGVSEGASKCEEDFRNTLIRKLAVDSPNWLKPPERSETVNVKYCPRCLQQFTEAGTKCLECGGRELLKF